MSDLLYRLRHGYTEEVEEKSEEPQEVEMKLMNTHVSSKFTSKSHSESLPCLTLARLIRYELAMRNWCFVVFFLAI